QCSFTGLLNHSINGIFEIIRVVGRHLVSIAEVHAIVTRAHLAQGQPEMSRDRFGLLERHSAVHWWFRSLVASPPVRHLLLSAKHLFVEAIVQKTAAVRQRQSGDGRRAKPRWRRSRRAGGGSSAVKADDRGGSSPLNVKTARLWRVIFPS